MNREQFNLPNTITVVRILVCPVLAYLALLPGAATGFAAFWLFVAAGLSDVWDGYLARKHDLITDVGKLLDPIADKLLLVSTLVPFYVISHRPGVENELPWIGPLPMWILIVIFGRELFITLFRVYAARRGLVIAAGRSGKNKALMQSLFIGGVLALYPVRRVAAAQGWEGATAWQAWQWFHNSWVVVTLVLAVFLTVYSLLDYLWSYRSVMGVRT